MLTELERKSRSRPSLERSIAKAQKLQNYFEQRERIKTMPEYNWDLITDCEKLDRKIGLYWYGNPGAKSNVNMNNGRYGYTEEREHHIIDTRKRIIEKVKNLSDTRTFQVTRVIIVYFTDTTVDTILLIKLILDEATCFIDPFGRIYTGFDDFLSNNQLQKGNAIVLFPENGEYFRTRGGQMETGIKEIGGTNLINFLDRCAAHDRDAVAVGWLALYLAPSVAAPFFAASHLMRYFASSRAACLLRDMRAQGRSINPFVSQEAQYSWLTICSTETERINLTAGLKKLACVTAHHKFGSYLRSLWNVMKFGNVVHQGISLVTNQQSLINQIAEETNISPHEILRRLAACYNFFHAIVNFESAESIIKREQRLAIRKKMSVLPANEQKNMESEIHKHVVETGCLIRGSANMLKQKRLHFPDEVQPANQSDTAKKHSNISGRTLLYHHEGKYITFPSDEAAMESAEKAVNNRYGGIMKENKEQTTTILSIGSTSLDDLIEINRLAGNVDATDPDTVILKGTMYATNVKSIQMNNIKTHTVAGHFAIDDVRLKLKNNKGWHLDHKKSVKHEIIIDAQNIVTMRATDDEFADQPLCIDGSPFKRLLQIKDQNALQFEEIVNKRSKKIN